MNKLILSNNPSDGKRLVDNNISIRINSGLDTTYVFVITMIHCNFIIYPADEEAQFFLISYCSKKITSWLSIRMKYLVSIICIFYTSVYCYPRVKTENGELIGTNYTLPNGQAVYAFLGVPFAAPPIGRLRFEVNL